MRSAAAIITVLVLLAVAGCAGHSSTPKPVSTLTEAQRDSAIARSSLPGADVVGRALAVSGQSAGRSARLDSLSH
jgi:hypothetical protein